MPTPPRLPSKKPPRFTLNTDKLAWQVEGQSSPIEWTKSVERQPTSIRVMSPGIVTTSLAHLHALLKGKVTTASLLLERVAVADYPAAERKAFQAIDDIIGITTDLFGEATIKREADPEYPESHYTVLVVYTRLDAHSILDLERQWIRRVREVTKSWQTLRLLVRPLE